MTILRAQLKAQVGERELDVSLEVAPGVLVLAGPNGAGKSSVFQFLLGLRAPRSGRIQLGDRVLFDSSTGVDVPAAERRIGWVPQDEALFPHLTAVENVAFGLHGPDAPERARAMLHSLEVEHVATQRPATLSGGERQRVALARALARGPQALLLDEPLSALDVSVRAQVRAFLRETLERLSLPAILIAHEPRDIAAFGADVAVMEAGRIVQRAPWAELVRAPATPFVSALVG